MRAQLTGDNRSDFRGLFRINDRVVVETVSGSQWKGIILDGESEFEDKPVTSYKSRYLVLFDDGREEWLQENRLKKAEADHK